VNLGNRWSWTILEFAQRISGLLGREFEDAHEPLPPDDPASASRTSPGAHILGWNQGGLEDGCRETISYFKALEARGATVIASVIQAAMNETPPKGVIAPSVRFPVRATAYRLPENSGHSGGTQAATPTRPRNRAEDRPGSLPRRQDSERVNEVVEHGRAR